jgi:hypothetical protein
MDKFVPDFSSVVVEEIELPYDTSKRFLKFSFSDEKLSDYSLIVIADSLTNAAAAPRLSTYIVRYPRYVHAEALRHRVISRNAASSRARSVKSTLREVMTNPVIPLFTVNQKGMGGKFASPEIREALIKEWLLARDKDVTSVLSMLINPSIREGKTDTEVANDYEALLADYYANGYDTEGNPKAGYLSAHKQQFNRIIEAYSVFEEVITASYWDNFLSLRDHEDAQPEIRAVAVLVKAALDRSTPVKRELHLPFIAEADYPASDADWETTVKPVFLRSSAEAAQISYNDKSSSSKSTATAELGARLFESRHLSPFEHPAIASGHYFDVLRTAESEHLEPDATKLVSNFSDSWVQLRPILAGITK